MRLETCTKPVIYISLNSNHLIKTNMPNCIYNGIGFPENTIHGRVSANTGSSRHLAKWTVSYKPNLFGYGVSKDVEGLCLRGNNQ